LEELTAIRDRLAAGQVPADEIERLAADAARAVQSARAALRRAGASIDGLSGVVEGAAG
jgi:L-serine deaminase